MKVQAEPYHPHTLLKISIILPEFQAFFARKFPFVKICYLNGLK